MIAAQKHVLDLSVRKHFWLYLGLALVFICLIIVIGLIYFSSEMAYYFEQAKATLSL
jgi:Na+-transporting methylmalonyl-CoA/oxaloacetate decarboxylase gamma subunit